MPAPDAPAMPRSQDEIVTRIHSRPKGLFGFDVELLAGYLDFEHVQPWLLDAENTTAAAWASARASADNILGAATSYLAFAFEKALDHRGISAARSVQKLTEWAWLMGRDQLAEQMADDANYPQYGVPPLMLFAREFDLPVPDDPELRRMAAGEPCRPDCEDGCGW